MITAILLAAGASQRMGAPKALLRISGTSFIRHIIDALGASRVSSTIVVLGADAEVIKTEIAGAKVHVVVNEDFASGQLSSIWRGIQAVRPLKPDAILLQPVDYPLVKPSVVNALIERFIATSAPIVIPVTKGKRGHPVLFSEALLDELLHAPPNVGARAVVWSHAEEVVEVEVNDEGIFFDVDSPADYERLLRHPQTTPL